MNTSLKLPSTLAIALCVGLAGCASTIPKNYAGLESSTHLQPNPNDESGKVPYTYSSKFDWKQFNSVIIDPVTIYRGADNQFGDMSDENKAELAQYMQTEFNEKLGNRFKTTSSPTPWTLRVKVTLTGAETNTPVISTVLRFDLVGAPYNIVQGIRGKEGVVMGSVSYSVEIYEALTNRLLTAYVTKEYPNAMNVKATFGALGASKAGIRNGAEDLVAKLN